MFSGELAVSGIESRRDTTGLESHVGRGVSSNVFEEESGEGWAWSRR